MEWHNHSVPRHTPGRWEACKQELGRIYSGETRKSLDVVQLLSCVRLFATPWTAAHQASLSFTVSWSLLKLISTESVMPSSRLIFYFPFSSRPQSYPASGSFLLSRLFISGGQILELQLQHQSFQCWFPLGLTGLIFLLSKGLSRIFSRTTVQKKEPYLSFWHTFLADCEALDTGSSH